MSHHPELTRQLKLKQICESDRNTSSNNSPNLIQKTNIITAFMSIGRITQWVVVAHAVDAIAKHIIKEIKANVLTSSIPMK